jgi:hypothetical protein
VYDYQGNLMTWGRNGDQPRKLLEGLGFDPEFGQLRELDGGIRPGDLSRSNGVKYG